MMTSESSPPRSSGRVALTASWKHTWVLQLPNSPKSSTMDWLSSPPARRSSNALEPVVSLVTALLLSMISTPVSNPPISAQRFLGGRYRYGHDLGVSRVAELFGDGGADPGYVFQCFADHVDPLYNRTKADCVFKRIRGVTENPLSVLMLYTYRLLYCHHLRGNAACSRGFEITPACGRL